MGGRITVWILGNQLLEQHPVLLEAEQSYPREDIAILMVESQKRIEKRPYHRNKLILLLSAMRHYAQELNEKGYRVEYLKATSFKEGLREHAAGWSPDRILTMASTDYSGRRFQSQELEPSLGVPVVCHPNTQFLISRYDPYPEPERSKRYLMEYFYRRMRQHFDILMEGEQPIGGRWNYDKENREPLPEEVNPPQLRGFGIDVITEAVIGELSLGDDVYRQGRNFNLATSRTQALAALDDFISNRLEEFGPYEDAMSCDHPLLFHSNLAAYLNLGLLEPMEIIKRAENAYFRGEIPINSAEGFIRQILGWREFIYWQYWRLMPQLAQANFWRATNPLPSFFWDGKTEMNCLRCVLQRALQSGYNHHIERLMILSNFCLMAGIDPQEVNDWFLAIYIDAYDWVMAPNVLGMGLNADGGMIATKPYIASANYINRMSDFCEECHYNHKKRNGKEACPFNQLYWNFLIENEDKLRANPRLGRNVLGLRHLSAEERMAIQTEASQFLSAIHSSSD